MISDLLDLASIDSGGFSIVRTPQDLGQLVTQALDELRPLADERVITVEAAVAPDLPRVLCDGDRITQVLSNMIGNALKFTPTHGRVRVLVEQRDASVLVAVDDNGPGISEEDLPHVFDRFYRSKQAAAAGTGLGLAIAKAIVELHDGQVGVESKLNVGSRFFFRVPLPTRA
jgi:signal transduction histidine kinase